MAKKRKKEKEAEEKYEFVPPEFDEKQFLKDEITATKRIVLVVLYGILFGALAAAVTALTKNGYYGFFMFLVGIGFIRYFLITMKIDLSKFTKKNWAESGIYFFFTFLAIWILAVNPPFVDYIGPEVKDISLSIDVDGTMVVYNYSMGTHQWQTAKDNASVMSALWSAFNNSAPVNIYAHVGDSSGLKSAPVITIAPNNPVVSSMTYVENYTYRYSIGSMGLNYLNNGQIFTFSISAEDNNGNQGNFNLPTSAEIVIS